MVLHQSESSKHKCGMLCRLHLTLLLLVAAVSAGGNLKCWQCAVKKGSTDSGVGDCPREAVLFELPGWDACMTWRLEDGRTVLQNFVMSAEDCTTARLVYWENYIQRVWKTAGWAECCYENECNSMGRTIAPPSPNNTVSPMNGASIYPLNQFIHNRPPEINIQQQHQLAAQQQQQKIEQQKQQQQQQQEQQPTLMNCFLCDQIDNTECLSVRDTTNSLRRLTATDPTTSSLVSSLLSNSVRVDFDAMVVGMGTSSSSSSSSASDQQGFCRCLDGYIPVMTSPSDKDGALAVLTECHDPIVRSAALGTRCLQESHCRDLPNTMCKNDKDLGTRTGIKTYKTCQCSPGYVPDSDGEGCVLGGHGLPVPCTVDGECSDLVDNAACVRVDDDEDYVDIVDEDDGQKVPSASGVCRCMSGYLPELNMDTLLLKNCRDPIVLASTVHGMCLGQGHCKFLSGTTCKAVPGSEIRTCQCKDGLTEDSRNPVTKLIPRCVLPTGSAASDGEKGSLIDDFDDEYGEYQFSENAATIIEEGDEDEDATATENEDNKETTLVTKEQLIALISAALPSGPLDINLLGSALGFDSMALESFSELITSFGPLGQEEAIVKGGEGADDASVSCQNEMTVVERNEWVPGGRTPMSPDDLTGTRVAVVYAKIPLTAGDSDGMLIRLMTSRAPGDRMYFIKILKNRQVSIGRSLRNSDGEETDIVQVTKSSTSVAWLNRDQFTGFWFAYNSGFLSMGVMNENFLDSPLASWSDISPEEGIDMVGMTAVGSAVFYRYACERASDYPGGVCVAQIDCNHLANTECRPKAVKQDNNATSSVEREGDSEEVTAVFSPAAEALMQACQCLPGFQMIPRVSRSTFSGGCYDPIVRTPTLKGRCLDHVHCQNLPNTMCSTLNQCVCLPGFRALDTDPDTGLVPGCEMDPNSMTSADGTVDECKDVFTLEPSNNWIPETLIRTVFNPEHSSYTARIFLNFRSEDTIVSLKFIGGNKSPAKFYKVNISGGGTVSIFEAISYPSSSSTTSPKSAETAENPNGGRRNEEILKASIHKQTIVNALKNRSFRGYWLTYQPNIGRVSVGEVGDSHPVIQWTDIQSSRLADADYLGIQVESGESAEIGYTCDPIITGES